MARDWTRRALTGLLLMTAVACSSDAPRGGPGEPCEAQGRCDWPLACISAVCVDAREACGNGRCDSFEDVTLCPEDCGGPYCGDDRCDPGEDFASCPHDCADPGLCGNGRCDPREDHLRCPGECPDPERCGNGALDPAEWCDATLIPEASCASLGFEGGRLACGPDCLSYDTRACRPALCGDGLVEGAEVCDGTAFAGATCLTEAGLAAGELRCAPGCDGILAEGCHQCGDDLRQGPEVCDGADLGGLACPDVGDFHGGELGCAGDCAHLDTSACHRCGDGVAQGLEVCDGADVRGLGCPDVGPYTGGTLGCGGDCLSLDTSACEGGGPGCDGTGDCGTCYESECAAIRCEVAVQACLASQACMDLYLCLTGCPPGDTTCQQGCADTYPGGLSDLDAMNLCFLCDACPGDCGATSPPCP